MLGGTPCNAALLKTKDIPAEVVMGVNLYMVLSSFTHRDTMDLKSLASKVSEDGKKAIVLAKDLLMKRMSVMSVELLRIDDLTRARIGAVSGGLGEGAAHQPYRSGERHRGCRRYPKSALYMLAVPHGVQLTCTTIAARSYQSMEKRPVEKDRASVLVL